MTKTRLFLQYGTTSGYLEGTYRTPIRAHFETIKGFGADEVLDYAGGPWEKKIQDIDMVPDTRDQLLKLGALIERGLLHPILSSVFALDEARLAFEKLTEPGKPGKIVYK